MKKIIMFFAAIVLSHTAYAAGVVATVGGNPITDADITARVKLMTLQGDPVTTDNRRVALNNIIDDYVKLSYAENFKTMPSDKDVKSEIKAWEERGFKTDELDSTGRAMLNSAMRANIAWQITIAQTIMPTIQIEEDDIKSELVDLEKDRGLPVDVTFIRLIDIPQDVAKKLTKPANCDAAMKMARDLGGEPQKITAVQYELSEDIRQRMAGLSLLTWSPRTDNSVILVCSKKKTDEYGKLDDIITQNAKFKRAMFQGDQILKQQRRKMVIVINDPAYRDILN